MLLGLDDGPLGGVVHQEVELGAPEAVDLGAKLGYAGGYDAVEALPTVLAGGHEPGVGQYRKVLGDRRPTHRELLGQLADRPRTDRQQLQQASPGRLGCCGESVAHQAYVSLALRIAPVEPADGHHESVAELGAHAGVCHAEFWTSFCDGRLRSVRPRRCVSPALSQFQGSGRL